MCEYTVTSMDKVVTTNDVLLKSCISDGEFVMFKI